PESRAPSTELRANFPFQHILPDSRRLSGPRRVHLPRDRLGRRADRGQQPIERAPATGQRAEKALAVEDLQLPLEYVHGVLEDRFESGGAAPLQLPTLVLSPRS